MYLGSNLFAGNPWIKAVSHQPFVVAKARITKYRFDAKAETLIIKGDYFVYRPKSLRVPP